VHNTGKRNRPPEQCLWALDARARNKWIKRAGVDAEGFEVVQPATVRCGPRSIAVCGPCEKKFAKAKKKRGKKR